MYVIPFKSYVRFKSFAFHTSRAKYPNVGIPVFTTPLTICEVKFIFTSPINHLTLPDHDFKMIFMS